MLLEMIEVGWYSIAWDKSDEAPETTVVADW